MIDFAKANLSLSSPLLLFVLLSIGVVLLYARPAGRPARRFFLTFLIGFWLVTTGSGARVLTMSLSHGLSQIHSRGEADGADVVVLLGGGGYTWNAAGRIAGVLTPSSILRVLETARVSEVIGRPGAGADRGGVALENHARAGQADPGPAAGAWCRPIRARHVADAHAPRAGAVSRRRPRSGALRVVGPIGKRVTHVAGASER
jgi:uncharacterized SAM-binding protein YcdF (DUF218 family)